MPDPADEPLADCRPTRVAVDLDEDELHLLAGGLALIHTVPGVADLRHRLERARLILKDWKVPDAE
jgi:hypothetical protein